MPVQVFRCLGVLVFPQVFPGVLPGVLPGVVPGVPRGVPPGVPRGVPPGVPGFFFDTFKGRKGDQGKSPNGQNSTWGKTGQEGGPKRPKFLVV